MKNNSQIYEYKIIVKNEKIVSVENNLGELNFKTPVTGRNPKLYFILLKKELVYIGITRQPIRNRLRIGVNPDKKTGYHGYKWLKNDANYKILIQIVDENVNLEGVEAEIIYEFRKNHGRWPKYQNEIHFHNINGEMKKLALRTYNEVMKKIQ